MQCTIQMSRWREFLKFSSNEVIKATTTMQCIPVSNIDCVASHEHYCTIYMVLCNQFILKTHFCQTVWSNYSDFTDEEIEAQISNLFEVLDPGHQPMSI